MAIEGAGRRAERSLLERALSHLARREHSRLQLRRRLAPFAASAAELEDLLDRLQREDRLSDERFADVLVRRRGERFGAQRIARELRQHGVGAEVQRPLLAELKQQESARARALWQRKFGVLGSSEEERARQARFLSRRGFSAEVVHRIVGGRDDD